MESLGAKAPKPPEYSYIAHALLEAYNTIARSRRYEQGTPLSLNIADLNAYCEQYELPVERYIFNAAIFAIDNIYLDEAFKAQEKRSRELKRKR